MPYVVAQPCINCKHADCVEVCPVDCFYEGPNFLAIHPDEIGVAKPADGGRAILLAPAPQIAPGKAKEYGAPAGMDALALERQEYLLDRVAHA